MSLTYLARGLCVDLGASRRPSAQPYCSVYPLLDVSAR